MPAHTFLVAEDSKAVSYYIVDLLKRAGVPPEDIDTAFDGRAAIELFDQKKHDIVFLDMEMPIMTGNEVGQHVLETEPGTTVVVISAQDREDPDVKQLIQLGIREFIRKPVRQEELEEFLRRLEQEESGLRRVR